ncbi:hypothetical protein MG296_10685 [Flavobacteriaceae bacterium TK19130]|nr:hypothetical protein [Thermobacterium salinum]
MGKLTLKDLAIDHDYYCSESNYYSNEAAMRYETFADFYEEFHDADVDMNLVFRWDLHEREESKRHYLEIFMMQQRKGIFKPIHIALFDESDVELLAKYLKPHIEKLKAIWKPFEF